MQPITLFSLRTSRTPPSTEPKKDDKVPQQTLEAVTTLTGKIFNPYEWYGIEDLPIFNVTKIENQTTYNTYNGASFNDKLPDLLSNPAPLAMLRPGGSGPVCVKLNNVFIFSHPGGKGSNASQIFYRSDDGNFSLLADIVMDRYPSLHASALIPIDPNAFYAATNASRWNYRIDSTQAATSVSDFKKQDLFVFNGQVQWLDCGTGAEKSMPVADFVQKINTIAKGKVLNPSSRTPLNALNYSTLSWEAAQNIKTELGLTCRTVEALPGALAFREQLTQLVQEEISLEAFSKATGVTPCGSIGAEEVVSMLLMP